MDDRVQLSWPQVGLAREVTQVQDALGRVIEPLGGVFVPNPLWAGAKHSLVTVHPLGGCAMGTSREDGVVDTRCEAFGHPGLYVVDGSVMPGPVGPNPSLTIAAIADRAATQMLS